ncbi:hypothetical protein THAOC_21378 [Thalassiosira oceanica]|uniref:Uncharacterized protein n=1 Tax=Thalassiosira oceanica TaxID=159749 RepID=K0RZI6_THAOC|nr:hypothetical protein THAOC_21378 [Thalassiosira oceanica]|eukprot:EJK58490.1 hypothetical protein THAOC_21378 [Thalassiosira oceanica]
MKSTLKAFRHSPDTGRPISTRFAPATLPILGVNRLQGPSLRRPTATARGKLLGLCTNEDLPVRAQAPRQEQSLSTMEAAVRFRWIAREETGKSVYTPLDEPPGNPATNSESQATYKSNWLEEMRCRCNTNLSINNNNATMKSYAALIISSYIASTRASSCNPQHAGGFRRLKTHATCYDGTGTSFRHIRSADQCAEKCTREGDMSSTLLLYGFDYDCDDDKCTCLYGTKWESGPKPNQHSRRNVACYGLEPFPPAPAPAPQPPQCNTYNEPCESDSDCMQGGFNPCTKCGKSRGTRHYKRCYGGDEGGEESEFLQSGESAPASDSLQIWTKPRSRASP